MEIAKHKVVSIDYTLKNAQGSVLDRSEKGSPLQYLHGAGNIVPGLERALEGRSEGESVQVDVPPGEGYGDRVDDLVLVLPRERFRATGEIGPGMRFQAPTPEGAQLFTVVSVEGDDVTIDGNHPLAGATLHFDVTVAGVRDATEEEIDHGHPHGPGGHDHD